MIAEDLLPILRLKMDSRTSEEYLPVGDVSHVYRFNTSEQGSGDLRGAPRDMTRGYRPDEFRYTPQTMSTGITPVVFHMEGAKAVSSFPS